MRFLLLQTARWLQETGFEHGFIDKAIVAIYSVDLGI